MGRKNKTASGRYNNLIELQRIRPFLVQFDAMIYLDEIISGGMMAGHLKDMFRLGIHKQIRIIAAGIADAYGNRSVLNRRKIEKFVDDRIISGFYWEGCSSLITEDQKFLLGIHYVDYTLGPHVVPVLDQHLMHYPEKEEFEREFLIERK
jgi:hypothetical protein